MGRHLSSKPFN